MCEQCKNSEGPTEQERHQQLLDYAWNWFAYHAGQRTNMFNYSLVAASLLAAGVAGALSNEQWKIAAALCLVGAVVAVSFWRIDSRNSALVERSEEVLEALEAAIFSTGDAGLQRRNPAKSGQTPYLLGILREDSEQHPDRPKWGAAKSFRDWADGYRSDWKLGKHGVHLRLIEVIIGIVFVAGGVTSLLSPELLTAHKDNTDAVKVANALDAVTAAIDRLNAEVPTSAPPSALPAADKPFDTAKP
jgi:hypothetical protein